MQLRKDDLEKTIKYVEKQSKEGFQSVMYLEKEINKPSSLIFLKNNEGMEIFERMNPQSYRYASADLAPLLDVLKTARRNEKRSPELDFPGHFPKKIDLTGELKEKQPIQEKTLSQSLRSDFEAAEKQQIKVKVRR
jgi:hypothetical protein